MLEAGAPGHVDIALLGLDASEEQVRRHRSRPVAGFQALVHGPFVVDEVERVGNRWNIDTGATFPGRDRLTLLHVNARRIRPWTFEVGPGSSQLVSPISNSGLASLHAAPAAGVPDFSVRSRSASRRHVGFMLPCSTHAVFPGGKTAFFRKCCRACLRSAAPRAASDDCRPRRRDLPAGSSRVRALRPDPAASARRCAPYGRRHRRASSLRRE